MDPVADERHVQRSRNHDSVARKIVQLHILDPYRVRLVDQNSRFAKGKFASP